MMGAELLAAFLLGLASAGHCLGMCGGILAALTLGGSSAARWWLVLAYNIGRVLSYATLGLLIGAFFAAVPTGGLPVLRTLAGVVLVLLGLYTAGWSQAILWLERLGGRLWVHIKPWAARALPVRTVPQALGVGFVWGWLPCGLVYSALAYAGTAGSALGGAAMMLAFGAGTLPAMLAGGLVARGLRTWLAKRSVRRALGVGFVLFGVWTLAVPWWHLQHHAGHGSGGEHEHHHNPPPDQAPSQPAAAPHHHH